MGKEKITVTVEPIDEIEAAYFDDAAHSKYQSYQPLTSEGLFKHDAMRRAHDGKFEKWWGHSKAVGETEWMTAVIMNKSVGQIEGEQ